MCCLGMITNKTTHVAMRLFVVTHLHRMGRMMFLS